MNKNIILILIILLFLCNFNKKEQFKPFSLKTKTTYASIPSSCLTQPKKEKFNIKLICDKKLCRKNIIVNKEFDFINSPCSGKKMKDCRKCLLNNLDLKYNNAYKKCMDKKKCLDNRCQFGFHSLEGIFKNRKILNL